jgi:spermidine synthase
VDLVRALWVVTPAAIFWGASFPLAVAGVSRRNQDPGRLVGTVYAANTVGAIVGAVVASLLIIAWAGTHNAQRILIGLAGISAALMLVPVFGSDGKLQFGQRSVTWAVVTVALGGWLMWAIPSIPPLLVAYGRYMVTWLNHERKILYVGEGMNSSMAVTQTAC